MEINNAATAIELFLQNPIVNPGTFMVEKDTGKMKLSTRWGARWNDLPYAFLSLVGDPGEERSDPDYLDARTIESGTHRALMFGPDDDDNIDLTTGRLSRPTVGYISFGDGDEVPSKTYIHGAINIDEIEDTPEVIGRRCRGQFVDGGIRGTTTLASTFTRGVSTTITCTNLYDGTVTWRDTGTVMIQDSGSGVAVYTYTSINRAAGTITGLTLIRNDPNVTVFAAGSTVTNVVENNTNLLLLYGQAWMGKGGYQDRSAQMAVFTHEAHSPDGYGGYFAAGWLGLYTSSPGPDSKRIQQAVLDQRGFFGLLGSGLVDRSAMTKRFAVAPTKTITASSFSLPVATIPVEDPSGFPSAGTLTMTSDAGSQTVTYTGYSATDGVWNFTGCAGGTGTVADSANVQLSKVTVQSVISAIRGNIAAQDDASADTVIIGKVGPTSADAEAGIKLGTTNPFTLYRFGSGEAASSHILRLIANGSTAALRVAVSGEAEPRVSLRLSGVMWGPGGSTAVQLGITRIDSTNLAVRDAADSADCSLRVLNSRITGALDHEGSTVGFYNTTPIAKQTGVAVTAAGIHAALVNLGLIAA